MYYSRYILAFLITFVLILGTGSLSAQATGMQGGGGSSGGSGGNDSIYQGYKQKKTYVFHPRPYFPPTRQKGEYNSNGQLVQSWKNKS